MTRRSPVTLLIHIGRQYGLSVRICCTVLVRVPCNALSDVRTVRTFHRVAAIAAAAVVVAADAAVAASTSGDIAAHVVGVVAARAVVAADAAAVLRCWIFGQLILVEPSRLLLLLLLLPFWRDLTK